MEYSHILSVVAVIAVGLLPSVFWLIFFMREDCHPEPKSLVAKTFLVGIIIAPIAIIFQFLFCGFLSSSCSISYSNLSYIFWAAVVEEVVKFYCVVIVAVRSSEFDEPVDGMIYMVTAALGFAAIENILFLFKLIPAGNFFDTTLRQNIIAIETIALRSLGATILHALSSAIVGYFLAMSWFYQHHKKKLILVGLLIASLFHFAFNIFLSTQEDSLRGLGFSLALLAFMSFLVYVLFTKVKHRQRNQYKQEIITN